MTESAELDVAKHADTKGATLLPVTFPEDHNEELPRKTDSSTLAATIETARRPSVESSEGQYPASIKRQKTKRHGQNKGRKCLNSKDDIRLCHFVSSGLRCEKEDCKLEHNITQYLASKPPDIGTICPVTQASGGCEAGLRCRWLTGHTQTHQDLSSQEATPFASTRLMAKIDNAIGKEVMVELRKRQYKYPRSDKYLECLNELLDENGLESTAGREAPLKATEKRKVSWRGARILAPLTTTGNLPFRQICRDFGADVTYSEMALSVPLLNGGAGEWALTRSHPSERDKRHGKQGLYGVQIAGAKPAVAVKAAEVLADQMSGTLDFIDLNCGCPIDLIFKHGAGSALLDNQGRLLKILKGMSLVSKDVPITCKIRTGVSEKKNTAGKLLARLNSDACVSMVTLHGRSRQQRYSRCADWEYIAQCAADIRAYKAQIAQEDGRGRHAEYGYDTDMAFVGNGDIYTYEDWNRQMRSGVDGCMIARGALIKPWIFEEIGAQQHLDKSGSERIEMLHSYCKHGLNYWGSDQMGVDKTRRFMLEFMSFHHRYMPVGLLENGPLPMNERRPSWTGRDDMESLLGSEDSRDWVKLSEMFLGKAAESFNFIPKHKTNMVEGEG